MVPRLKRVRVKLEWSQETLAEKADCDRIGILHYERGLRLPSTAVAMRIAEALKTTFEDVWREDTEGPVNDLPRGRPRKNGSHTEEVLIIDEHEVSPHATA